MIFVECCFYVKSLEESFERGQVTNLHEFPLFLLCGCMLQMDLTQAHQFRIPLPGSTGGVESWVVQLRQDGGGSLLQSKTVSSSVRETIFTGLQPGTSYVITIASSDGRVVEPPMFWVTASK